MTDAALHPRSLHLPVILFLLLAASFAGPALATTVNASCGIRYGGYLDTGGGANQSSAACSAGTTAGGATVSGTAGASAGVGALHADASISATSIISAHAEASGAWYDSITLTSIGASPGTTVQVHIGFYVTGFLDASEYGQASYNLRFGACGGNPFCFAGTSLSSGIVTGTSGDPAVGTVIERTINVELNEVTGLSMQLDLIASKLETPGDFTTGSASVNFANSIYWDGIRDVLLNGVSIPYELTSESGVDLTQSLRPVPVPAALWLFGSAVLVGGLRCRARR